MTKKFNLKLPSMLALSLFGATLTAQHAHAAESTTDQSTNKNVIDQQNDVVKANKAKKAVSNAAQNVSGVQAYHNPSLVKSSDTTSGQTYDAKLDTLTDQTHVQTSQQQNAKNQQQTKTASQQQAEQAKQQADTTTARQDAQTYNQNAAQSNKTKQQANANVSTTTKQQATQAANTSLKSQNNVETTNQKAVSTQNTAQKQSNSVTTYQGRVGGMGSNATKAQTAKSTSGFTGFRKAVSTYKATSSLPKYKPQVNSSINDYIRKNNIQAPKIEEDYTSYFPKYGYRNGVGKPEGIVVHDTANDNSTIDGEIAFMKRNYNSAFVHAFVDGNRIVETAPTDYLSWGAGPNANNRFINVEIVHTHDYASFARSMNNYADYAATQLQYYGLKPDSAENDGNGTVWTHYAVSHWLGGTDHTDPHAYLQSHGYSYAELYDLINEKYLIKTGQVAPWGTSSSTDPSKPSTPTNPGKLKVSTNSGVAQIKPSNSGLFVTVYDKTGKKTNQVQKTLSVTKQATLGNDKFYLVNDYNTGKTFGWVKQGDVVYNTAKSPVKVNQSYSVKPGTKFYTVPWGTPSQVAGTVSGSSNQTFKATKSQMISTATYLYGTVNGKSGWISKAYLSAINNDSSSTKPSTDNSKKLNVSNLTNTLGQVSTDTKSAYTTVYDKTVKENPLLSGRTFSINKKATLNNKTYYLLADFNGNVTRGWVPADQVTIAQSTPTKVKKQYNVKGNANIYYVPWSKDNQVVAKTPKNGGQFNSIDQLTVGKETYLHGSINHQWGWIKQSDVATPAKSAVRTLAVKTTPTTKVTTASTTQKAASAVQTVNKIGQVKVNNSGIRTSVYDKAGKNAAKYGNRTFTITKQRTVGNNTYVLLTNHNQNTPIGWYNIKDVNIKNYGTENRVTNQYRVNSKNQGLYSIPWGTTQQQLEQANSLAQRTFKATKSVTIDGVKYLYGSVNNKLGWIAEKDLTSLSSNTAYNYTFVINNKDSYFYDDLSLQTKHLLSPYYEQTFVVAKYQVVNGVKWYYGQFSDGQFAWINENDLSQELIKYSATGMTLDAAAQLQMSLPYPPQSYVGPSKWRNATLAEVKSAMDTSKFVNDPVQKYQFLQLDQPQYLSVASLNNLLKGCGVLENQGQAFSQAAKQYGLNEIYLISHALLETGRGQSQLAKGANIVNGKLSTTTAIKYHNVFGIGAYDSNPVFDGITYAKKAGWDSVEKAIVGGAQFIGQSYVKAGQNTLYKMRWNPENPGKHQYATGVTWASVNAQNMKNFYDTIHESGKYFDVPTYK